jgi:predicted TIM-barrel enzyme
MKIYPVVHVGQYDFGGVAAARESDNAFELGADGVYLIDHFRGYDNTEPLFDACDSLLRKSPDRYVGINILGLSPVFAMQALAKALGNRVAGLVLPPTGLWVDDMRSDSYRSEAMDYKKSDSRLQRVRIIGGVAFKYTDTYTENPDIARSEALYYKDSVDVVVTSGSATGKPASVEKCRAMKEAIDDKPLAVASGISIDNIVNYKGSVDEILASSSIETNPGSGKFDLEKLEALIKAAHSLSD